jgi:hypothetical protein
MKRSLLLLCFAYVGIAHADDFPPPPHQHTSPPTNARFEVLQSSLAAKWTFRLDRYTGRIWQLVKTKDDDPKWEEMPVLERPASQAAGKPRFQLFTSGLAARHTFLIDTESGKSWIVVSGKRKSIDGSDYDITLWQPFAD